MLKKPYYEVLGAAQFTGLELASPSPKSLVHAQLHTHSLTLKF